MTSPPETIEVRCPRCGKLYETWYRPSINLTIEHWDDEDIDDATSATCPDCGLKVRLGALIVREDGVWEFEEK